MSGFYSFDLITIHHLHINFDQCYEPATDRNYFKWKKFPCNIIALFILILLYKLLGCCYCDRISIKIIIFIHMLLASLQCCNLSHNNMNIAEVAHFLMKYVYQSSRRLFCYWFWCNNTARVKLNDLLGYKGMHFLRTGVHVNKQQSIQSIIYKKKLSNFYRVICTHV